VNDLYFSKCLFDILKWCWCLHVIINVDWCLLILVNWMYIFKCEYFLTVMYTCLNVIVVFLLSESIHVFKHLLCWIYSHPLVVGWAPAPLWCKFAGRRSLVAVSLWGWFEVYSFSYRFWESLLNQCSDLWH